MTRPAYVSGAGGLPPGLSRRGLLAAGVGALGAAAGLGARPAEAAAPIYLSGFARNRYFAYSHNNAFFAGGRKVVLGQRDGPGKASLWARDFLTGINTKIADFEVPVTRDYIYYDVSDDGRLLVASDLTTLWAIDLTAATPTRRRLYTAPPGNELDRLASVRFDAGAVLTGYRPIDATKPGTAVRVRVSDGRATQIFTKAFGITHLQYSPKDVSWIGFAPGQGARSKVWGYNRLLAPGGRLLWDQMGADGRELLVGHTVWCRHALSALTVAYGSSPGSPRGLYEVRVDGGVRLVQEADDYSHCNVSRDGRRAVVDTDGGGIVLVDMVGLVPPRLLARTRCLTHPAHPHPAFTPDGSKVIFTDTEAATGRTRVAMIPIA